MAGTQVPSTFDAGGDLTPVSPETVQPSLKDRILGGAGKVVQSASGQDPTADSPLSQAIAKHHKQQADEANMHQQNTARYYAGHLMVRQGINPETQQRFDDPTYKGPSQADMDAKYTNFYNSSYQHYLKAAGLNKELKEAITKQGDLMNHVSTVVTQKSNAQNAATNAAKGGIQPPPGSGSSPAAPGTTTGSAPIIGGAGGDSGAPAAAAPGGLTPPPKSDTPPAAQASPPAPAAKGNSQVPAPPTPPADDDFSTLSHMSGIAGSVQGRSNARAQAIADQLREDKQHLNEFTAQQDVIKKNRLEEIEATAAARNKYGDGKAPPRPVFLPTKISTLDARKLASSGRVYEGEDGYPIDVSKLPDNMSLQGYTARVRELVEGSDPDNPSFREVWKTRYIPVSPNQKSVKVGKVDYEVNPADASKIPEGAGVAVGPTSTAQTSSTLDPVTGLTTTRVSTPTITGATGRGVPPPPGSSSSGGGPSTPKTPKAASPAAAKANGISLDGGGHIPLDTPGYTKSVIEAANQLMDERDVDKIPAKVRLLAADLARKVGWEQGKFSPKEMTNVRLASDFIDNFAQSDSLSVLDSGIWDRAKLINAMHEGHSRIGQVLTSMAAQSLDPKQQEFVRAYNQALGTISGLSTLTRGGRITESQIDRLKKELADAVTSASSTDARAKMKRLQVEIADAMSKGNFDHVQGTATARPTNSSVPPPPKSDSAPSQPRTIRIP